MRDFSAFLFSAVAIAGIAFGAFVMGGAVGMRAGREATQREAVENGAGRWIIDQPSGEKSFAWTTGESCE